MANDSFHFNLNDVLVQNQSDCLLNVAVQYDHTVQDEFLVVGLATFARSQYLVYDFTDSRLGLGGAFTAVSQKEDPHKRPGMPGWAVFLIILIIAVIIGVVVYLYLQMRRRKIEMDLEQYDDLHNFGSSAVKPLR